MLAPGQNSGHQGFNLLNHRQPQFILSLLKAKSIFQQSYEFLVNVPGLVTTVTMDIRVLISLSQPVLCCYIRTWKTEQTVEKTSVPFTPLGGSTSEVRGFASHLHHLWVEGKGKETNLAALNSLKLALICSRQWSPHEPNMSHQAPPPHIMALGIKFSTRVL